MAREQGGGPTLRSPEPGPIRLQCARRPVAVSDLDLRVELQTRVANGPAGVYSPVTKDAKAETLEIAFGRSSQRSIS